MDMQTFGAKGFWDWCRECFFLKFSFYEKVHAKGVQTKDNKVSRKDRKEEKNAESAEKT
jgi:hypothetical protein